MLGVCLKYTQHNYGSKLQALATVRLIEELSIDYEIIEYNKRTPGFLLRSIPRFFNWVFICDRYDQIQRKLELGMHPDLKARVEMRDRAFDSFDVHFLGHVSEKYASYKELKKLCADKYEKVLTCSDQLWSPSALGSGFYNLMFVPESTPKISWASSFGVSDIPWYQKSRTERYLSRIEHISMRENRGAEIVRELTGREVPVLMDPVFAYDKDGWDALVAPAEPEWEDYIFCYFLGSDTAHRDAARKLAQETGKKIVTLRHLDRYVAGDETFGDIAPYDVDPVRFLNILRGASYVCTDSFHGTAFSVIFEKKFVVFDRYSDRSSNSKNSRIDSVCKNLGLSERRFSQGADILDIMERDIDHTYTAKKMAEYRESTRAFLRRTLADSDAIK